MAHAVRRGSARYSLEVLGGFRLLRGNRPVHLRPSAQRPVAGLAVLGPMTREAMAARLWPDHPRERAHGNVRTALWRVRADAPGLVREDPSLCALESADVDVAGVRDWSAELSRQPCTAAPRPPSTIAADLLPHWDEEWLIDAREEFRMLRLRALETCGEQLLAAGAFGDAALCGRIALRIDPLRETSVRLLVEVYLREGNQVEALRQYRRYCHLLVDEIGSGVAPAPPLTELVAAVFRPGLGRAH